MFTLIIVLSVLLSVALYLVWFFWDQRNRWRNAYNAKSRNVMFENVANAALIICMPVLVKFAIKWWKDRNEIRS